MHSWSKKLTTAGTNNKSNKSDHIHHHHHSIKRAEKTKNGFILVNILKS